MDARSGSCSVSSLTSVSGERSSLISGTSSDITSIGVCPSPTSIVLAPFLDAMPAAASGEIPMMNRIAVGGMGPYALTAFMTALSTAPSSGSEGLS